MRLPSVRLYSAFRQVPLKQVGKKGASSFRTKQEGFFIEGNKSSWMPFLKQLPHHYRPGRPEWLALLNGLWKLRGFFDWLIGGPGLRGVRTTAALVEGDILDFLPC